MRTPLPVVLLTSAALLLAGCQAKVVDVFVDPAADFSAYRTFGFASSRGVPSISDPAEDPGIHRLLREAIGRGLEARGYDPAPEGQEPDLTVAYRASIRTRVMEDEDPVSSSYAARYANFDDVTTGRWMDTASSSYEEGTLLLSVIDTSSDAVLWRGKVRREVREIPRADDLARRRIDDAVTKLLAELPARAP